MHLIETILFLLLAVVLSGWVARITRIALPLVQIGLGAVAQAVLPASLALLGGLMFLFFVGFNALEASQPSLVSRMAPAALRGAALGAYNTLQSLGLFAGGFLGGVLAKWGGMPALFTATAALMLLWLGITWALQPIGRAPRH